MDQERARVQADLRGLLRCDVLFEDVELQMYANEGRIYEMRPLGVVCPRNVADVAACVQYAAENGIPIHARGAGSGLAGEALGTGLVIDFSYGMRKILSIDDETVRFQPGVVLADLNRQLAKRDRHFGPDPS